MDKKNRLFVILDIVIVLIVAYFILAYFNFQRVVHNKKPFLVTETTNNTDSTTSITTYNGVLYRITQKEDENENKTVSLKLWFQKNN